MPEFAELHRQVEQLALQLVLGDTQNAAAFDSPQEWLPKLDEIHRLAQGLGAETIAQITAGMVEGVRNESGGASAALTEGIGRLQQALEAWEKDQTSAAASPLAEDPELLSDFVMEVREHLATIESQLLSIEREPSNSEALHTIFRAFHTIKGLSGFLELWEIQKLAHQVETVLDKARNSQLAITPAAIDVFLESADYLKRWVAHLEAELQKQPTQAPDPDDRLLARVTRLSSPEHPVEEPAPDLARLATAIQSGGEPAAPAEAKDDPKRRPSMAVRVDTAKLDYLADMAGELVIAEALVRHDPDLFAAQKPSLQRNLAQLTRITAELQRTAMAMRLVPIGPLFKRMERLVRDLSRQFGKAIEMQIEGEGIELDRTIVEELADPLMHMVRNSMDHGVESPEERQALGKSPTAHLLLKAQHQAGQVVIEISDDGRGLDRRKILAKASEKGILMVPEDAPDTEVFNLIFAPGFTTARQVTNVSGRGVGMDVVRRHIEKLRGKIEIRSTAGRGASFFLKLPLTLAIIEGLVVAVGAERYIVPLFAVREMFRPKPDTIWTVQGRAEMALVRNTLLPVLRLYRRFGVVPRSEDPLQSVLVVAELECQRFCLLVDELLGKQEVVIKGLGAIFKNIAGVAGGAILGDGRVGLILDLEGLFKDRARDDTH